MGICKQLYREFCAQEDSIPIFSQDWWLDAVCGQANWDVSIVQSDSNIQAAMPYYNPKPGFITMPPLTQTMGPWISPGEGKYEQQLSREKKLMTNLIDDLPRFKVFSQKFHFNITNWLPFYWKGFQQTTMYTYIIENISDLESVWKGFSSKHTRSPIRKAQRNGIRIVQNRSFEEFYKVAGATFRRQGKGIPVSSSLAWRLYMSAFEKNAGKLFFAVDDDDQIHAVAFLVWSKECAYYLMGGADPTLRSSGAQTLLLWELIQFSAHLSKNFDFEGSMIENVEKSFRGFGARQYRYFRVWKDNRKFISKSIELFKNRLNFH